MPVLQFFVPYAGRLDYLQTAVRSVVTQSDPSWELVVSQDGADQVSPAVWLEELGDPRITLVVHAEPLGVAGQFQWCVEQATAPLTTIMGCDDELLPNYLASVRRLVDSPADVGLAHPRVDVMDAEGRPARPLPDRVKRLVAPSNHVRVMGPDETLFRLALGNWMYFPAICWRTADLRARGFDVRLHTALDLDLLVRMALGGRSVLLTPEVAFRYRRHAFSASSTERSLGRFAEEAMVYDRLRLSARQSEHRLVSWAAAVRPTSRLHRLLHSLTHLGQ